MQDIYTALNDLNNRVNTAQSTADNAQASANNCVSRSTFNEHTHNYARVISAGTTYVKPFATGSGFEGNRVIAWGAFDAMTDKKVINIINTENQETSPPA